MEKDLGALAGGVGRCIHTAALALPLLLAACGGGDGSASPPTAAHSLGLMQLTVSGIGSSNISSHATLLHGGQHANVAGLGNTDTPSGLDVEQVSASTVDVGTRGAGGMRYISVVYKVRNAQKCDTPGTCAAYAAASNNLTLVAANTAGNLGNTAVSAIALQDGSSNATVQALATQMLPTDGMQSSNPAGGVALTTGQESLQVFDESEITGSFIDPDATYLFPYGYVVGNINTPASRSLPVPAANEWDGQLTFAFKVPLQAKAADDPFSISFVFDVLDDTNTRVTESAEEQTADGDITFNQLAATLGSSDLAVLGGHIATTNIGAPICTVRTAGPAGAATAYLANNGGAPTPASAPSNLTLLPGATLNFGFCAPIDLATATPATVVLNGSESGLHSGTVTADGNLLSFTPAKAFTPGETVSYTVTTGVQAVGGTPLPQALAGEFSVGGLTPSAGTFAAHGSPLSLPSGASPLIAFAADFNGDGKLDLVISDFNSNTLITYLGHGDGTFAAGVKKKTSEQVQNLAIGDFNGDGKLDILFDNVLLPGNGDGTFGAALTVPSFGQIWLVPGDYNGDGKLDLLWTDEDSVYFSPGNGDGSFGAAVPVSAPGLFILGFATGDFNGDGKLDLAVPDLNTDQVYLFLGNGDGSFTPEAAPLPVGSSPTGAIAGDFNGDGILDLVTANSGDGAVSLLLGKGDGSFGAAASYPTGQLFGLIAADVNGDGRQDLIEPNFTTSTAGVLLARSDGSLNPLSNYSTGGVPLNAVVAGDFNGDGKIDLIATSTSTGKAALLLGQ